MFHICIEIRYYHQLIRIVPETINDIVGKIILNVQDNGGEVLSGGNPLYFSFDDSKIGGKFACLLSLAYIKKLFDKFSNRINEYTVLCCFSKEPKEIVREDFENKLLSVRDDRGIFCDSLAAERFEGLVQLEESDNKIKKFYFEELMAGEEPASEDVSGQTENFYLIGGKGHWPFRAFREMFYFYDIEGLENFLEEEDRSVFKSLSSVCSYFDLHRYGMEGNSGDLLALEKFYTLACFALVEKSRRNNCPVVLNIYNQLELDKASLSLLKKLEEKAESCKNFSFKYYKVPVLNENNTIPDELLFLLYVCSVSLDYIYSFELKDFFKFLGRGEYFYNFLIKLFKVLGFVYTKAGVLGFVSADMNGEIFGMNIDEVIGRFLWEKFRQKELSVGCGLFLILNKLDFPAPLSFIQAAVYQSWEDRNLVSLKDELIQAVKGKKIGEKYTGEIISLIQGYSALLVNNYNAAENYFAMGSDNVPEIYLGTALLLIKNRNYAKAVEWVKKSLIAYQNDKDTFGELRALFMMSRISMLQERFSDAFDYLEYSFSCAETISDIYWKIKIRMEMAVNSFIQGNFAKTIRMGEEVLSLCSKSFYIEYELLGLFVLGRVCHITGDYKKAGEFFEMGIKLAGEYKLDKSEVLFRIWQGRVLLYQGDYSRAEKIFLQYQELNPDSFLFLVESSVMYRNKLPPTEFLNRAVNQYQNQSGLYETGIYWDSGFNFLEDKCFEGLGNIRISLRILDAYMSLLKFKNKVDLETALKNINHLTRDSGYLEFDPNNAMYFYFYYLMTEEGKEDGAVDKDTLLGRAFKCMQERVSKIDDAVIQSMYMQDSYWNSKIYAEAKNNKLV